MCPWCRCPRSQYARNGDVALAYQVVGEGSIDLVFLPAFVNNIEIAWESPHYARFLRRLASFSRLIFMDRRGTGLSDRFSPSDLPPLEVLMDDLLVVLDAVGAERPALFGFSDAGCLCALFAATYPDRVSALALYAVAASGAASDDYPWQWGEDEWDAYMRELADGWGTLAYTERILPVFHPEMAGDEQHLAWMARFMRQAASPNSVEAIERLWHQIDVRPILPTITAPTLVLHRIEDQVEVIQAGRDVADRIPGARFVELPGGDDASWVGDPGRASWTRSSTSSPGRRHAPDARPGPGDRPVHRHRRLHRARGPARGPRPGASSCPRTTSASAQQLERFRGREIDTAGDGFLATFDGPARAVRCGQAIARERPRPRDRGPGRRPHGRGRAER